jgi:hypothetical protein
MPWTDTTRPDDDRRYLVVRDFRNFLIMQVCV